MKALLLTLTVILTSLSSCENQNNEFVPTLPPITQTGENTFGCYIDGKLLTPRDGTGLYGGSDDGMTTEVSGEYPNLNFRKIKVDDYKSGTGGVMDIYIKNPHDNGEGTFEIENNIDCSSAPNLTINIRCSMNNRWYCSVENTGTLTITRYDYNNRILSGTFSCTAVNRDDPTDFVEITQGRFDIKWDTLLNVNFP